MTTTRLGWVTAGLLAGLGFYLTHRSDFTVSNRLLRELVGADAYGAVRAALRPGTPWPLWLTGCLPSALWCFIVASGCGGWRWRISVRRGWSVPLGWGAALANLGWEGVQAAGWNDGRADWRDAAAGIVGCAVAHVLGGAKGPAEEIRADRGWRWVWALTLVVSMGMADVWR